MSLKMHVRAFIVLVTYAAAIDIDAYCKLSCSGEVNVVCKWKCQVDPACMAFKHVPLTDDERQYMLDEHNRYRNKVASGKDTRGGNGAAANMMALNYDREQEIPALCWGKRCYWGHDKCRATKKFPHGNGQNLYDSGSTDKVDPTDKYYLDHAMTGWYEEITDTTKKRLMKLNMDFPGTTKQIGHFTQMMWATTTHVGCTRVVYDNVSHNIKYHRYYLLCNYGPAGNYEQRPVYEFGEPVSNCPAGVKPNEKYKALCGEIKKAGKPNHPAKDANYTTTSESTNNRVKVLTNYAALHNSCLSSLRQLLLSLFLLILLLERLNLNE